MDGVVMFSGCRGYDDSTRDCRLIFEFRQSGQDDTNLRRMFNVLSLRQAQDDINGRRIFNVFNASSIPESQ